MGDYADALAKDLKRIEGELDKLNKALKKNPSDTKALKQKKDMAPFLTEAALDKRWSTAQKMDKAAMGKLIKETGLPW